MKIAIGNDHTAIELKNIIKEFVEEKGYEVIDLGTNSTESCDYPIYGEKVGRAVADGQAAREMPTPVPQMAIPRSA